MNGLDEEITLEMPLADEKRTPPVLHPSPAANGAANAPSNAPRADCSRCAELDQLKRAWYIATGSHWRNP